MGEPCVHHGETLRILGEQVEANKMQSQQITEIFTLLRNIQSMLDQNQVRAATRDRQLADLKVYVSDVEDLIKNGLTTKINDIAAKQDAYLAGRKHNREMREKGFYGAVRRGWYTMIEKGTTFGVLLVVWFILWVLVRMGIFQDSPDGLLKLFGK